MTLTKIAASVFLFGFTFVFCQWSNAQNRDSTPVHLQVMFGGQYIKSTTWDPYQLNILTGISLMYGLNKSNWSVDGGITTAFHPGKDLALEITEANDKIRPFFTGSEVVTVYAGLGQSQASFKKLYQYAGGVTYCYSEFSPWIRNSSVEKRNTIGGYVRCAMQYQISSTFLMGPFASLNIYPSGTINGTKRNLTSLSIGISFGPCLKD